MTTQGESRETPPYVLDDQVGFLLRQVVQRHTLIFAEDMIEGLTPTQFAALQRLAEHGPTSQNRLGRLTAMDGATIKGVIDRLTRRGFTTTRPDPSDARLLVVALTEEGSDLARRAIPVALGITERTLEPLTPEERSRLLSLLRRLL